MSSKSARPNTWTVVSVDENTQLSYAPQVNPSPLTVGSGNGSLEIVITNPTKLGISVKYVEFIIKIAGDSNFPPYPDSTALTTTTADIKAVVSDSNWTVEKPNGVITHGTAHYKLKPMAGQSLEIPAGGSVVVQIYDFPINVVPGTSTVQIKEDTSKGIALPSFTVTTFPWGFAFSDLTANVPDNSGWKPVAQVEKTKSVTLFWHGSVLDAGSYTVYYSDSKGQQTCTPKKFGEWTSHGLTEDTVFTLGVSTNNSVGEPLQASMSVAVAVSEPDLVANSLSAEKVGIGTSTPGFPLSFENDLGDKISLYGQSGASYGFGIQGALLQIHTDSNGADIAFGSGSSSNFNETVRIKGNGNVGIGTSTPGFPLSFKDQLGDKISLYEQSGAIFGFGVQNNLLQIYTPNNQADIAFGYGSSSNFNESMRIINNSAMQLGGSAQNPVRFDLGYTNFAWRGSYNAEISNDIGTFQCLMLVGNTARGPNWSDRWVGVWDSLDVANDLYVGGATWKKFGDAWLAINYGPNKAWAYWSDARLKSDVQPVASALSKVRQLRGVTFRWNEDGLRHFTRDIENSVSAGPRATQEQQHQIRTKERDKLLNELSTTQVGVVAQDVEAVLPEAVTTDADGYKSVHYDKLIPLLIEAIKEQHELSARQQREIDRLKQAVSDSQ